MGPEFHLYPDPRETRTWFSCGSESDKAYCSARAEAPASLDLRGMGSFSPWCIVPSGSQSMATGVRSFSRELSAATSARARAKGVPAAPAKAKSDSSGVGGRTVRSQESVQGPVAADGSSYTWGQQSRPKTEDPFFYDPKCAFNERRGGAVPVGGRRACGPEPAASPPKAPRTGAVEELPVGARRTTAAGVYDTEPEPARSSSSGPAAPHKKIPIGARPKPKVDPIQPAPAAPVKGWLSSARARMAEVRLAPKKRPAPAASMASLRNVRHDDGGPTSTGDAVPPMIEMSPTSPLSIVEVSSKDEQSNHEDEQSNHAGEDPRSAARDDSWGEWQSQRLQSSEAFHEESSCGGHGESRTEQGLRAQFVNMAANASALAATSSTLEPSQPASAARDPIEPATALVRFLCSRELLVARVLLSLSWRVLESNTAAPTRGVSDACDDECESEVGHEDEEEPQSHVDEEDSQSLGDEEQSPVDTDEESSAPAAKPRVEEIEMAKEDKDVKDVDDREDVA